MTGMATRGEPTTDGLDLVLHLAGPGAAPFPTLAAAAQVVRNARAQLPGARIDLVVQGPAVAHLALRQAAGAAYVRI